MCRLSLRLRGNRGNVANLFSEFTAVWCGYSLFRRPGRIVFHRVPILAQIRRPKMGSKLKACILGSGNWGSAIARIIGRTVKEHSEEFDSTVKMWVYEEIINGQKLSEIINTKHENVKYLPGRSIPENIVAVSDLAESVRDADILIFVVPHQFVKGICGQLRGKIKDTAIGISLIKPRAFFHPYSKTDEGLAIREDGGIKLISELIEEILKINIYVLMGANLASEVAGGNFCEATIGTANGEHGAMLKRLFETDNFRIAVVEDAHTVELCGALKNVVACGAGFTDGLGYGDNTKAAVIRLGLMEMTKFIEHFYPGSNLATFFESCGIADLITTCYGGRNRRVCDAFVKNTKTIEELEKELLNGQSLQGPHTAAQVFLMLQTHHMEDKFPLFASIHRICTGQMKPREMIDCLRHHPEHF